MSIRSETPCDYGECPYSAQYHPDCEYWCGADPEPEDNYWDYEDMFWDEGYSLTTDL